MNDLFFREEHTMLVDMVRDFAKNEIEPVARELDEEGRFPEELVSKMADLGLMGIPIPEEYGGAGMDMTAFAAVVMELAKADASVAITVAAHISLGTMPILMSQSEILKDKYLPKLASGEMLGAFGLTEPEAGSDAGATKTTAVKDGDDYVINGGKIFITNVGYAGILNLTARIEENGDFLGIGAFTVPTDTPGLKIGPPEKKMGWRASDTRQLFFEDMRVSKDCLLSEPGAGFKAFLKTLTGGEKNSRISGSVLQTRGYGNGNRSSETSDVSCSVAQG